MDRALPLVLKEMNDDRSPTIMIAGFGSSAKFWQCFGYSDAGVSEKEIPHVRKLFSNQDEQDEEDLEEPEFQFSKHEALNAVAFLQNIAHHRPDLDVALPVRTTITSFFK
ncbi:hypothetical protein B0H14DRAFT_2633580 [Mycena olivaceomarginata]|nr:hypothetical protein B0H14DRAFT_2633580 [Mycena olivaceomarginata]